MVLSKILSRENNNIDLLRLFAALLVAWWHAPILFGKSIIMPPLPQCISSGALGVAIFFFFSGMLVTNSLVAKKSPVSFAWSRLMRIYPAFFVMLIIAVFVIGPVFYAGSLRSYFLSSETWQFLSHNMRLRIKFILPGLWEDRINTGINPSTWTIPLEVGCYICLLFSFILCQHFKIKPWLFIIAALAASLLPHEWFLRLIGKGYSIVYPGNIFCFTIGATMALYKDRIKITKTLITILMVICVMVWRCENLIYYLFPLTVSIVLLYATSIAPLVNIKPKHDVSYGIYIWHWPVYQIMFTFISGAGPYLFFVACMVITVALAYLSAIFVEEPCMKFGKQMGRREFKIPNNSLLLLVILFTACVIAKIFF